MDSVADGRESSISAGVHEAKINLTIKTIQEYQHGQSEELMSKLLRDLTLLGSSGDADICDISTTVGAQFISGLYDLLSTAETTSSLLWSVISILQKVCAHNYKRDCSTLSDMFVPLVGRLLLESLPHEKKLRLLCLLQALTYNICIQWQAPYLQPMLSSLASCVKSADTKEVSLSLSIMVNLLHRNPTAKHSLLSCVKIKVFLKQLFDRDIKSLEYSLEVAKMMVLMANHSETWPDEKDVKKFISLTFQTVIECVKNGNISLAQHTVNFFEDVTQYEVLKSTLLSYSSYETDINTIVTILEGKEYQPKRDMESVLLQFLGNLVSLFPPKIIVSLERIVGVSSKIITSEDRTPRLPALNLLLRVFEKTGQQNTPECQAVNQAFQQVMPALVGILRETQPRKEATTVLQLLCRFANVSTLKRGMISLLDLNVLRAFFDPFVSEWHQSTATLPIDDAVFYVEAVSLVSKFISQDGAFLQFFSWLTQQNCVLFALATALKSGPPSVQNEILKFPTVVGFSDQSVSTLVDCLNKVSETFSRDEKRSCNQMLAYPNTSQMFGVDDKARLNDILSRLEKSSQEEVSASMLTSLFQYRMDADAREIRLLNSNLEIANSRIALLCQQRETSADELQKLRFCLLDVQRRQEQTKIERDAALVNLASAGERASKAHKVNEEKVRLLQSKVAELERINQQNKKTIEEQNTNLQKQSSEYQTLRLDMQRLDESHKATLRLLLEKDEEIKEKSTQIHQLEIIKNAIYEISSGNKKI